MDEFIKFNNQTSGRDKIFRLCQYSSRVLWYSLQKRHPDSVVAARAKHLDEVLGLMRRLLRFGRFYESLHNTFPVMSISDSIIRLTSSLSRIANACFMLLDHVVCLDKLKLLPKNAIDAAKWDLLSSKFWLYAILLGLIRDVYDILRIYKEEFKGKYLTSRLRNRSEGSYVTPELSAVSRTGSGYAAKYARCIKYLKFMSHCVNEHADVAVDTLKNVLDLFIPLNTLGVVKLSPGTIGLLGSISTIVSSIPQLNPLVKMVPSS